MASSALPTSHFHGTKYPVPKPVSLQFTEMLMKRDRAVYKTFLKTSFFLSETFT